MNKSDTTQNSKPFFETEGGHHFFGYYDKCPWSAEGGSLLSLEVDFLDRLPNGDDVARIGVVDMGDKREFRHIAETRAWNWQQGCMVQWMPTDYQKKIIYNDLRDGRFVSIILDIETNHEEVVPYPMYAVHPDGTHALSLSFSRLDVVREGYGYKGSRNNLDSEKDLSEDGIFSIDLKNKTRKLIISLRELYDNKTLDSMNESRHWVDHITLNLSGTRFAFFHRWEVKHGGMYSRLYTANFDGSDLFLLLDTGMASHFSWKSDSELLAWARPPGVSAGVGKSNMLRSLLVPIYHALFAGSKKIRQKISGDSFLLFQDQTEEFKKIGEGVLTEDGHCSFSPDKRWVLTDTFSREDHIRTLILFNLEAKKRIELGSFSTLPDKSYGIKNNWDSSNLRSDLHPRFNRNGTQICFDSVHTGSRQVHIISI